MTNTHNPQHNTHTKVTANVLMHAVYYAAYPMRTDKAQGTAAQRLETILNGMSLLSNIKKVEGEKGEFARMAYRCALRYAPEGVYNCLTQMAEESQITLQDMFKAAVYAQLFTLEDRFVSPTDFITKGGKFAKADCSKKNAFYRVQFLLDCAQELSEKNDIPNFTMDASDLCIVIDKLREIPPLMRREREIDMMHLVNKQVVRQIGQINAKLMIKDLPEKADQRKAGILPFNQAYNRN